MARRDREEFQEKVLDVDASMQGMLTFKDPVNLRINGNFEGKLDTKGKLTIGENANVKAEINGEEIIVGGKITGNVVALKELRVLATAHIVGDITMPVLTVAPGAVMHGTCRMLFDRQKLGIKQELFTVEELARYLEVEISNILEWANSGRLPGFKEGDAWRFDRQKIDEWVVREKIR